MSDTEIKPEGSTLGEKTSRLASWKDCFRTILLQWQKWRKRLFSKSTAAPVAETLVVTEEEEALQKINALLGGKSPSKICFIVSTLRAWTKQGSSRLQLLHQRWVAGIHGSHFLKRNTKMITLGVTVFVGFWIIVFSLIHADHRDKHGPTVVSNLIRINNIQDALNQIQNNIATTSQMSHDERLHINSQLQTMDLRLGQLSSQVGIGEGQQIANLQATVQSNQLDLAAKINALNHEIKQIKTKVSPAPMLSVAALPFKVVSIEPWNGKPYVEIQQRHDATMIDYVGLYGVRGGWKVIELNAPRQTVTFLNESGQVVHVHVQFQHRA